MISQPMGGLSDEEIIAKRDRVRSELEEEGHSVIDTFYRANLPLVVQNSGLFCHAVYFCSGWENARGCKIEHDAAISYGMRVLYEE